MPYPLTAQNVWIAPGNAGIIQTVHLMQRLAAQFKSDPVIRQTALNIVNFLAQKDYQGEIEALFYFVRDQIRYVQDIEGIETLQTPVHTLMVEQGDCDDKSTLLVALLGAIGFPAWFKLAAYEPGDYTHVYVVTTIPGEQTLIPLDTTEPQAPGWEPPHAIKTLIVQ